MIRTFSLQEIQAPLDSIGLFGDFNGVEFERVSTDTRSLSSGDLFVALRGERYDAHERLGDAVRAGACAIIVERKVEDPGCPVILVDSTQQALADLATLNRRQFNGPLIALTGSCGKTTTKEMLATLLSQFGTVHATRGNLNNHFGVPLTLLDMPNGCDYAVIEMGASGPGEIESLTAIAEPTISLVNNVMAAHLQGFNDLQGVADEKSRIYFGLAPEGTAVINLDEPYATQWMTKLESVRPDLNVLTFSMNRTDADVFASSISIDAQACTNFCLNYRGLILPARCPLPGSSNLANAMAAVTCCVAAGCDPQALLQSLSKVTPVPGRLCCSRLDNDFLLIDDSYNANPGSVMAAADVLIQLQQSSGDAGTLVLGDLAELGDDADVMLLNLGRELAEKGVNRLVTCGTSVSRAAEAFRQSSDETQVAIHVSDHRAAVDQVLKNQQKKAVVLIKGSRSSAMEKVVDMIIAARSAH